MAAEAPHLRPPPQLLSPARRDSRRPDLLAPTRRPCARDQHVHPADAEGADADEHPTGECHQRSEWLDRAAHRPRDARRRARSEHTGRAQPLRHSRHPRHDRQEPRRHLAARPLVCASTRGGDVRRVSATDRRMRSGARTAFEGRRRQSGRHGARWRAVPHDTSSDAALGSQETAQSGQPCAAV